ncbi:MAG: hypothetical protein R3B38_02685 [Patescibacteria group bacterium]
MGAPTTNMFEGRLTHANLQQVVELIKNFLGDGGMFTVHHEQSVSGKAGRKTPNLSISIGVHLSESSSENYNLTKFDVDAYTDSFTLDWHHLNLEVHTVIKDEADLQDTEYPNLTIGMNEIVIRKDIFNTWTISRT